MLAYYQGKQLRQWIESTLETRFGLTINRDKTKVVRVSAGESLDFLGFTMRYERSVFSGCARYLHTGPSRKAMARIRDRLRELTETQNCYLGLPQVVRSVNSVLRGWSAYFGYGHPRRAFAHVNWFAYERVAIHARRRSQRGCRPPEGRTIYAHLYEKLGLQKLCSLK